MNTADLITAFLSNEMNPAQEREFLLSVAASDTQRLALKSHVMLDRVLAQQVQRASVPDSVRGVIFSAAAASLAEPLPASQADSKTLAAQNGFAARLRSFVTRAAVPMVATMLTLAGFAAGYYTSSEVITNPESSNVSVVFPAASATPRVLAPVQSLVQHDVAAAVHEETPAAQAVSRPAERKVNDTRPAVSSPARTSVPSPAVGTPSTSDPSVESPSQSGSTTTADSGNEPSRSSVGNDDANMRVNVTIKRPSDTISNKPESNQGKP
jgi:hypothetical protein